jgi:hypothetical protein
MREDQWLSCADPEPMLDFLGREPSRKLKLFGCACIRRIWRPLTDRRCRRLVEVAERDADGRARPGMIAEAIRQAKAPGLRDDADHYALFALPSKRLAATTRRFSPTCASRKRATSGAVGPSIRFWGRANAFAPGGRAAVN